MTFDPRKTPPRPQAAVPTKPQERLPLPAGTVVGRVPKDKAGTDHLTDFERAVLENAGAAATDIVLGDTEAGRRLGAEINRLRKHATDAAGVPDLPVRPPIVPPTPRDFTTLTAEEQREIQQRIADVKRATELTDAMAAPQAIAGIPGMQEAWQAAIVDDITPTQEQPAAKPVEPQVVVDASAALPADMRREPTHTPQPVICVHCGCNAISAPVEITSYDKAAYLAMILGSRFYKEYELFSGHMHVTFRNLTLPELDMVMAQLAADRKAGTITTIAEYNMTRTYYEIAASLARVATSTGNNTRFCELHELDTGNAKTPLPALRRWIDENVVTSTSVSRVIAQKWLEFSRLLDELDAKKDIVDFFSETVPVPSSCKD